MADQQKESSVLFSLKELMGLEQDRINAEEQEQKRKADAEIAQRLEVERKTREEEQARIRADEERKRVEEVRAREEAARLEAIRQAEIEKARLEAENAARMEALKRQQEHEQALTALKQDKHKKKLMMISTMTGAVLFFAIVGGGWAIKAQHDKQVADALRYESDLAAQKAESDKLQRELQAQTENISKLTSQLAAAHDEASRAEIMRKIDDEKKRANDTRIKITRNQGTGTAKATGDRPKTKCAPGDPLCAEIQ